MKKYLPFLFLMLLFTDAFTQTLKHAQQRDSLARAWRAEQEKLNKLSREK